MEDFDPSTIKESLEEALSDPIVDKDNFTEEDNASFVREVLGWAEENEYLSFHISSSFILNEMSK
jgi:hypothetical protein